MNAALKVPDVQQQLKNLVVDIAPSQSHTEYAGFIRQEVAHWSAVLARMAGSLQST